MLGLGEKHNVRQGQGLSSKGKVVWLCLTVLYLITYCEILLPAFWMVVLLSVKYTWRQGLEVLVAAFSTGAREPRLMCWGTNELLAGGQ